MHLLATTLFTLLLTASPALAGAFAEKRLPQPDASAHESGWSMPQKADVIHLSWLDGPPQIYAHLPVDAHLAGFRPDAARLAFRSGRWGMLLDPVSLSLERFTLGDANAADELLNRPSVGQWPAADLELRAKINGRTYRVEGTQIDSKLPPRDQSPVHIVQSGDWFQHIVIHNLDLVDDSGERLNGQSRLEIRAWGDRCLFEWIVEPADESETQLEIALRASGAERTAASSAEKVRLGLDLSRGALDLIRPESSAAIVVKAQSLDDFTRGKLRVRYSPAEDAWEIFVPKQHWPREGEMEFVQRELLERVTQLGLKLRNTTDQPVDLRLRFAHDYHPISGFVPMILNSRGEQTGLPIQTNKNWHSRPDRPLLYDNAWIRMSTRLRLEPQAEVDWRYEVVHALWEGLPASSVAHLCLIGWGFNGFWTQMALGAWGETLCLQPGRTMRRSFVTDVRPFMVTGSSGEPYYWTPNVGGADIAKLVDPDGRLVPWVGAIQEYPMAGPILSHHRVVERSADDALRLRIDSFLPRSASITRGFFRVQLDVLQDTSFSELSLFQLGSDYYSDVQAECISWGEGEKRVGSESPPAGRFVRVMEPVPLRGEDPWVCLHDTRFINSHAGQAVRGMVLRDYHARIGGVKNDQPWLAASRTNQHRLNAELILPPEVNHLKAGDRIEFTLEFDIFPISLESYYGPDEGLKERLRETPDSWQLAAYEARRSIRINGATADFPATVEFENAGQRFRVEADSGLHTVRITGLPQPGGWQITELADGKPAPLGSRFPSEARPQVNYDPETRTWTAVLSLRFPPQGAKRTFLIR